MALRNVRIQGLQSSGDPPNTSLCQVTSGSSSAGQPQIQPPQDSRVPGQETSTLEERPQEPVQTQETQVILLPTRPHSPGSFSAPSPTAQAISGQALNVTGRTGDRQSMPDEEEVPPERYGSVTPTPRNSYNATITLDTPPRDLQGGKAGSSQRKHRRLDPYSDEEIAPDGGDRGSVSTRLHNLSPRGFQSGSGGPSRHGKQRRLEPFSDDETGADGGKGGDILMEDGPNFIPRQREPGGVYFIPLLYFPMLIL